MHTNDVPASKADARAGLLDHLRANALRTDGPFVLSSGATSDWYLDGRQTTFDGTGALLAGKSVLAVLGDDVTAVGGMTMGADPIAVATAMAAALEGRTLRAFSVRKQGKEHGVGGRLVGPVDDSDRVAVLEDTTTTGSALVEAIEALGSAGIEVRQAVALVDRSAGVVAALFKERGIPYTALVTPADLGVGS